MGVVDVLGVGVMVALCMGVGGRGDVCWCVGGCTCGLWVC